MNRNKFHKLKKSDKEAIFIAIGNQIGMPAFAVEKDWWVTQTLALIFEMEISRHLVFKGGTSLSKAWKLIHRFSEDIDLAIDKEFFEFSGELSRTKITSLRKIAGEYSSSVFFENLERKFREMGFHDLDFMVVDAKDTDQDPRIIEIHYSNIISTPGYVLPKVQIEIGCRSLKEPFGLSTFGSLVDEIYAGRDFASPLINVPTVNPERTFLEKVFLLHEEFHRPSAKIRVDRLSRHLYDIYYLSKTNFADKAINDKELYETIVNHRYRYARVGGVDYNSHHPDKVNPIPPDSLFSAWKADYAKMVEGMIYEANPPEFDLLIDNLKDLRRKLGTVKWDFSLIFP